MTRPNFDPARILGDRLYSLSRKELCELVTKLCAVIRAEAGPGGVRGGIYPGNISVDENGSPALGPACVGKWSEDELRFAAPEIYWDGKTSPASDVYSLGLLLYCGVNRGVLPFEGQSGDARQRRFDGESFTVPVAAGTRLGSIIERATRFKASERYQSMEELGVLLEGCVKNLYIDGEPNGEALFQKSDEELDPIERMMLGIIAKADGPEEIPASDNAPEFTESDAAESVKTAEVDDAVAEVAPADVVEAAPTVAEKQQKTEAKTPEAKEKTGAEKGKTEKNAENVGEKIPTQPRRFTRERKPIVILTEEKNPELAPVVPAKAKSAASYGGAMEREKKMSEKMKQRRRRSVAIILVMCAVLVIIAIVFNALLRDLNGIPTPDNATGGDVNLHTASPDYYVNPADPSPSGDEMSPQGGEVTSNTPDGDAESLEQTTPTTAPQTSPDAAKPHYEIFVEDVSWTEAQARCNAKGGHLAVVRNQTELEEIIALADEKGVEMLWLGCHRVDGELVWEDEASVDYYPWGVGEPSLMDTGDNVAEDYLLLWYHNVWAYNDSRNDPVADYPQWYSGNIAYVCEY